MNLLVFKSYCPILSTKSPVDRVPVREFLWATELVTRYYGASLLTPDELKALPKGEFIVTKTGSHPMRTRLQLFLDWGITFEELYQAPEHGQRKVYYAGRQELEVAITARFGPLQLPEPARTQGRRPKRGGAPETVAEGLRERADLRKEGAE